MRGAGVFGTSDLVGYKPGTLGPTATEARLAALEENVARLLARVDVLEKQVAEGFHLTAEIAKTLCNTSQLYPSAGLLDLST